MNKILALDVETTTCPNKHLRVITIADPDPRIVYNWVEGGDNIPEDVRSLLNSSVWVVFNGWFDVGVLHKHGIRPQKVWDVMMAEIYMGNISQNINLYNTVKKYKDIEMDKSEQMSDWSQVLTESQKQYCYQDVKHLLDIYEEQLSYHKIKKSITHVELKNELIRTVAGDLHQGFPVDVEKFEQVEADALAKYTELVCQLCERVPINLFRQKNSSVKSLKEHLSVFCPEILELPNRKPKIEEFLESERGVEALRSLFIANPANKDIFVTSTGSEFAKRVAKMHNVELPSYAKAEIEKFLDAYPNHPLSEDLEAIQKTRQVYILYSTYTNVRKYETFELGGNTRARLKPTHTVTGRVGLQPICRIPREKTDVKLDPVVREISNKIRGCYIPPKGYKTIDLDFQSVEDVLSGVIFDDPGKLNALDNGYDQYLKFASVMLNAFKYDDPSMTDELKKEYKTLRSEIKAMALASNYGAGKFLFEEKMNLVNKSVDLPELPTGQELYDRWGLLYPNLRKAQQNYSDVICKAINDTYSSYSLDNQTYNSIRKYTKDKNDPAHETRADILRDSGLIINVGSLLGLQRVYRPHAEFNTMPFGSKAARITTVCNHPIQTTGAELISLAVVLVKSVLPQLIVGAFIHDSLILFAPEDEDLDKLTLKVQEIMGVAGWILLGRHLKTDAKILDCGF